MKKIKQDWETGIIEIKFKEESNPRMKKSVGTLSHFRLKSRKDMAIIKSKLKQFKIIRIERVKNLSLYFVLIFHSDTDVIVVSRELEKLEFVEKASPRTKAIPPKKRCKE